MHKVNITGKASTTLVLLMVWSQSDSETLYHCTYTLSDQTERLMSVCIQIITPHIRLTTPDQTRHAIYKVVIIYFTMGGLRKTLKDSGQAVMGGGKVF